MAENLFTRYPLLSKLAQRDVELVTGSPFPACLLAKLEDVVREMEEVPAAFPEALRILKGPPA
jgi:hypothetical protein